MPVSSLALNTPYTPFLSCSCLTTSPPAVPPPPFLAYLVLRPSCPTLRHACDQVRHLKEREDVQGWIGQICGLPGFPHLKQAICHPQDGGYHTFAGGWTAQAGASPDRYLTFSCLTYILICCQDLDQKSAVPLLRCEVAVKVNWALPWI